LPYLFSLLLHLPPSTDFCIFIYVIKSPNPSTDNPNSCTILLPNSNSIRNPSTYFGLLGGTCSCIGLNSSKAGYVAILSIYCLVTRRPLMFVVVVIANVVANVVNILGF
jgi:hypothetical protein